MKEANSVCEVLVMEQKEDAAAYLGDHVQKGDVVYIKASNGMKLKKLQLIYSQRGNSIVCKCDCGYYTGTIGSSFSIPDSRFHALGGRESGFSTIWKRK